jgi:excisionase family DNA binding protein
MKRREAKSSASEEQLALPFDHRPNATRSNGAEPLAVRIPDAVRMTGIGRSKLYELIASGDLETIKIGRCTLVTIDALKALLAKARADTYKGGR